MISFLSKIYFLQSDLHFSSILGASRSLLAVKLHVESIICR